MAFSDQGSADFKQHLNLSETAWETIHSDRYIFGTNGEQLALSTFLNHIFTNFYTKADASIAIRIDAYEQKLKDTISSDRRIRTVSRQAQAFIDKLLAQYETELKEKKDSYQKGHGEKFRINTANFNYLTGIKSDSECSENEYYNSIGSYLKALFEEYAALSQSDREVIFYQSRFDEIERALNSGKSLKLTNIRKNKFEIRPYKILQNRAGTYHYLVGYGRITAQYNHRTEELTTIDSSDFKPISIRISNIEKATVMRSRSGFLSSDSIKELDELISTNGPEYIAGAPQEIRIRLTQKGIKQYNIKLFNRPPYDHIEDGNIYVFQCNDFQIKVYFLAFAADAEILSPASLRDFFARQYARANEIYSADITDAAKDDNSVQ